MDNFIEGRQKARRRNGKGETVESEPVVLDDEVVERLIGIRSRAYAAFKAGNYDLMFECLAHLEAECRLIGLTVAVLPEVALAEKTRTSKSKSGGAERAMKIDGEKLNPLAIISRLARERDELGFCWTPAVDLWDPVHAG